MILLPTPYLSSNHPARGLAIQMAPLPLLTFSPGVFWREQLETKALQGMFFLEVLTLWLAGK